RAAPSRRVFVRSSGQLMGCLFMSAFRRINASVTGSTLTLVREFPHSRLVSVSADGTRICLEDWKASGYPLSVVELVTWQTIYTGDFQVWALSVGFFSDGTALFLTFAPGKGQNTERQVLVDIPSGTRTERMRPSQPNHFFEEAIPIDGRNLLVAHY